MYLQLNLPWLIAHILRSRQAVWHPTFGLVQGASTHEPRIDYLRETRGRISTGRVVLFAMNSRLVQVGRELRMVRNVPWDKRDVSTSQRCNDLSKLRHQTSQSQPNLINSSSAQ